MKEYQEHNKPIAMPDAEHENVVMNAWQMIVTNFDTELADGRETFTQRAQQSVEEEYSIYVMGALSGRSVFDTLGYWKVSFFLDSL